MSSEFDGAEPVLGLPERLPRGEQILWQGQPNWRGLARRAFHVRKIGIYFAILMLWRIGEDLSSPAGLTVSSTLRGCGWLALLGSTVVGMLMLLAWLCARCTVYTLTNRRLVIRHGIALPMSVNVPFGIVGSADLHEERDGSGDLALKLTGGTRLGYLLSWPHVRPWRFKSPQPMLRSVPAVHHVAAALKTAVAGDASIRWGADFLSIETVPSQGPSVLEPKHGTLAEGAL